MPPKAAIGLDIGSRVLKALQLSRHGRGRYTITQFSRLPFNPDLPLGDQVRQLLERRMFNAPILVTSVSGRNVFVRHHVMSAGDDDRQLREMLKYEIGKFVPVQDVGEVMYDFDRLQETPAGEKGEKEVRLLVAGVRRSHLDPFLAALEAAAIYPDVVDVDACALANAFWFVMGTHPGAVDPRRTIALVDLGASKVDVHIVRGGGSFFARESYKGGNDITDAISKRFSLDPEQAEQMKLNPGDNLLSVLEGIEAVVYDICNDVRAAIDYFEAQYDVPVDEILLTGGGSRTPGLWEGMEKVCQRKVNRWRPAELVPRQLDGEAEAELRAAFDEATLSLGLAARLAERDELVPAAVEAREEEVLETGFATQTGTVPGTSPMIWIPEEEQKPQEGQQEDR